MSHTTVSSKEWSAYDRRAYADWFSQLEGARSPVLVGTTGPAGHNVAIFNSMTHIGARPPLLGLVFRPLTVDRHTYDNIKRSGFYTVNHVTGDMLAAAHRTSGKYPAGTSEFEVTGLYAVEGSQGVPYVAESPVSFTLEFAEEHHIAANDAVLLVGAVREIRLQEDFAFDRPAPDWSAVDGVVVSGLYSYYQVGGKQVEGYVKV